MRNFLLLISLFSAVFSFSQNKKESAKIFKKRVLETAEVDLVMSYYAQKGDHASVTGGVGTEKLNDITSDIIVSIPINDDDVLTVDAGISAYSSASSSNLDPFDASGASRNGGDDDDRRIPNDKTSGSPWIASSGASKQDVWGSGNVSYAHNTDDRNTIWSANAGFAAEFDYFSIGFGGGLTKLFNKKNTEIGVKAQLYLDTWLPVYPTELDSYLEAGKNLTSGFFSKINILDENYQLSQAWSPDAFSLIKDKGRNTYSVSLNLSQIVHKKAQFSLFADIVLQKGWLSNPMQRVYFADKPNFYVGGTHRFNASGVFVSADPVSVVAIDNYTNKTNTTVFQLADDIERLPSSRFKLPIGMRFNYFVNEIISVRTYYRYYFDDWGVRAHTASIELPIKVSNQFTLYPTYRFYQQNAATYFGAFDTHLSTSKYYTSDYDLSAFNSNQYGMGIKYTDIFAKAKVLDFGIKSIDIRYNKYTRTNGLDAGIISFGMKFVN